MNSPLGFDTLMILSLIHIFVGAEDLMQKIQADGLISTWSSQHPT